MYEYAEQKEWVFSEEGQKQFLSIRDRVKKLIASSGAVTMEKAIQGETGVNWNMMACVDRLVELHEIFEVPSDRAAQFRIFMSH
jgi:hypothetical protein